MVNLFKLVKKIRIFNEIDELKNRLLEFNVTLR
jgi:hypothetical protein